MITSATNSEFRRLKTLQTSKGLKEEAQFFLMGENLIREFLKNPNHKILSEVRSDKMPSLTKSPQTIMTADLFRELDSLGTHFPLLILEQPQIETWQPAMPLKGTSVFLPLGDPGNLGAALRSCEAFGVENVILCQEAAHPYLPKTVKGSSGSLLRLKIWRGPSIKDLPENLYALDGDGENLYEVKWPSSFGLLVGEEGPGLPLKKFSKKIRIPTRGVESLNAVVSLSIVLAEIQRAK